MVSADGDVKIPLDEEAAALTAVVPMGIIVEPATMGSVLLDAAEVGAADDATEELEDEISGRAVGIELLEGVLEGVLEGALELSAPVEIGLEEDEAGVDEEFVETGPEEDDEIGVDEELAGKSPPLLIGVSPPGVEVEFEEDNSGRAVGVELLEVEVIEVGVAEPGEEGGDEVTGGEVAGAVVLVPVPGTVIVVEEVRFPPGISVDVGSLPTVADSAAALKDGGSDPAGTLEDGGSSPAATLEDGGSGGGSDPTLLDPAVAATS